MDRYRGVSNESHLGYDCFVRWIQLNELRERDQQVRVITGPAAHAKAQAVANALWRSGFKTCPDQLINMSGIESYDNRINDILNDLDDSTTVKIGQDKTLLVFEYEKKRSSIDSEYDEDSKPASKNSVFVHQILEVRLTPDHSRLLSIRSIYALTPAGVKFYESSKLYSQSPDLAEDPKSNLLQMPSELIGLTERLPVFNEFSCGVN